MCQSIRRWKKPPAQTYVKGKQVQIVYPRVSQITTRFLVARDKDGLSGTTILRSYATRQEVPFDITIVDAVLATCATEPDFSPVTITSGLTKQELVTGGLGANNPTRQVLHEAQLLFGGDIHMASLVSLGSGHPSVSGSVSGIHGMAMERILSDSQEISKGVEIQIGALGFYFRFSTEQSGSEMDTHAIATHTSSYLQELEVSSKLDRCVTILESRLGLVTLDQIGE